MQLLHKCSMEFRHLKLQDKIKTLPLYEEAFPEDRGAYASYYYQWKCRDNEIFVLTDSASVSYGLGSDHNAGLNETEGRERICSMLHLNPYRVWVSTKVVLLHYIVAVATASNFRRQGCMRRLMLEAFAWLYRHEEPFTYLMPADIRYYEPFGFRVIYDQIPVVFPGEIVKANRWAKENFDVVTLRDEAYERFLEAEPVVSDSEDAADYETDVMEIEPSEPDLYKNSEKKAWKPQIMCRIIHVPRLLECIRAEYRKKIYLQISDTFISENTGVYCWDVDSETSYVVRLCEEEAEKVCKTGIFETDGRVPFRDNRDRAEVTGLVISIEELAEQLFGVIPLHPSLAHVKVLRRICINEEV